MTGAEIVQAILASATFVSALAGLIVAIRSTLLQQKTHELVNGQAQTIANLSEAKGHAEGIIEGVGVTTPLQRNKPT